MKYIIIILFFFLTLGCSSQYQPTDKETLEIAKESSKMLKNTKTEIRIKIERSLWPPIFNKINVESVAATKQGLYLLTNQFFVEESGFFIPRKNIKINEGTGSDPSYKLLTNGVYLYKIKG